MKFAEKLLKLRKENGLSQEELAEKISVSRQAISRWEMGTAQPDVSNVLQISKLFGVSTDYLLNDEYESDEEIPCVKKVRDLMHEKSERFRKCFLVAGFIWLFAAGCFLIAGLDRLSIWPIIVTFMCVILACVCFYNYWRKSE